MGGGSSEAKGDDQLNQKRYCEAIIRLILAFVIGMMLMLLISAIYRPEVIEPPRALIRAIRPSPVAYAMIPTATPTPIITPMPTPKQYIFDDALITVCAQMIFGEGNNVSVTEQAAILWTACNRVDSDDSYYPDDLMGVITQDYQFCGYSPDNPVTEDLKALAVDVLTRWERERDGEVDVGRVLPKDYCFFTGDGQENYFRSTYEDTGEYWQWELPSPYES